MDKVLEFIEQYGSFLVYTHINPDGDALGSAFSLTQALRARGKKAVVLLLDEIPAKYAFDEFEGLYTIWKEDADTSGYEACISVDCADLRRLGKGLRELFFTKPNANIDHHISNTLFAQVNFVQDAPATGEMVYDIASALGAKLDGTARLAIYMALSTDTGNFTYQNTTPKTLHICSELVDAGLDISYVAGRIYNNRTLGATKLISIFIDKMRLHMDGKMAMSIIMLEDIQAAGAKVDDCEVLINYARDIDSVELAAFVREIKKDTYKISLRSKGGVDVSDFASRFDGGGHVRAAGFMLCGDINDVIQTVVKTAEEVMP